MEVVGVGRVEGGGKAGRAHTLFESNIDGREVIGSDADIVVEGLLPVSDGLEGGFGISGNKFICLQFCA